jgi:hypothetical protein
MNPDAFRTAYIDNFRTAMIILVLLNHLQIAKRSAFFTDFRVIAIKTGIKTQSSNGLTLLLEHVLN